MARAELEFEVLKDETGSINGFSLCSKAQAEAEFFCMDFPDAVAEGRATITLNEGQIIFDHPNSKWGPGKYEFALSPEEYKGLVLVLQNPEDITVERIIGFSIGFKVIQKEFATAF